MMSFAFSMLNIFFFGLFFIASILFMIFCLKGIQAFNVYIAQNTMNEGERK